MGPAVTLRAQMIPPIKVMKTIKPVGPPKAVKDGYLYDLGQNFSGWPRIVLSGPKGAKVRLMPGELFSNGQVNQSSSGSPAYFQYTLERRWPRRMDASFQLLRIPLGSSPRRGCQRRHPHPEGTPVIEELEGQVLYPDVQTTGTFECSNPLLNRIHEIINWAIISNMKSVLTDCPHREKLGWLEQTYLNGPGVMFNYDVLPLYRKIADDMAEAQLEQRFGARHCPGIYRFSGRFSRFARMGKRLHYFALAGLSTLRRPSTPGKTLFHDATLPRLSGHSGQRTYSQLRSGRLVRYRP